MNLNVLTLFVELKGLKESSLVLDIPEETLSKYLGKIGTHNSDFFKKVVECIKNFKSTTSLEATSEYFAIPEELVRVLTEENYSPPFFNLAKSLIQEQICAKFNKMTQTVTHDLEKYTETHFNYFSVPYPLVPQNYPFTPVSCQADLPGFFMPSINPYYFLPKLPSRLDLQNSFTDPVSSSVEVLRGGLPACRIYKRKINYCNLKDHFSANGNITNPDYSYSQ